MPGYDKQFWHYGILGRVSDECHEYLSYQKKTMVL